MLIGTDKAMDIAAAAFGKASTAKMAYSAVDPELDESPAHYEVEIKSQTGEEFEYKVDAYTGAILESKREAADGTEVPVVQPSKPAASGDIGYAKAKSVALNHAGVSEGKAYDMEIELDDEDGRLVYEIEFKSGNMEYSYEINAATGAILKHEAELDD